MAEKPLLVRTIAPQGSFVCMASIMDMECVLEKNYIGSSPACGELLDAAKCAQERFSQSLYACHKCMCVISSIHYFGVVYFK